MQQTVKQRLIEFIKSKGLSQRRFETIVGLSNGYVNNISSGIGAAKFAEISKHFPDLNRNWLLTGDGEMLGSSEQTISGIPYYKDIPVSAGQAELQDSASREIVVGSINIGGVTGKYAFPVIGCSMEPVIHAGDIIVVDEVNRWDRIDPDKIYLIITRDDRMIKRLEIDDDDDGKLWCVSHNYKRFSINKEEIVRLYRVTFYGRLV